MNFVCQLFVLCFLSEISVLLQANKSALIYTFCFSSICKTSERQKFWSSENSSNRSKYRVSNTLTDTGVNRARERAGFFRAGSTRSGFPGFGPVSGLNFKSGPGSGFKIKFFSGSEKSGFWKPGPGRPARCRALGVNVQKWTRAFSTRCWVILVKKRKENSVSTFGRIRLWTSFESSPVSVKGFINSGHEFLVCWKFIPVENFYGWLIAFCIFLLIDDSRNTLTVFTSHLGRAKMIFKLF